VDYQPRLPAEGINTSSTHPLREAALLLVGVFGAALLLLGLGTVAVELLAPRVPPTWEARIFAPLARGVLDQWPAAQGRQKQAERAQSILERLGRRWPENPYRLQVQVVEESEPNALALPGGAVVVTTGLLDGVSSEQELAFVLAHELGHFLHRDHLRRLGRSAVFLTLAVLVSGGGGGTVVDALARFGEASGTRLDRAQELAADRVGLLLLFSEYGDVGAALDFFEHLPEGSDAQGLAAYVASHPEHARRVEALRSLAAARGWPLDGPRSPLPGPAVP